MNYEITGKLIEKYDIIQISDKFRKADFVIEVKEVLKNGFEYLETIKFQLTQEKCNALNVLNFGEMIKVSFNIRGKRWEKNGDVSYFNSLDAWKIERVKEEISNARSTKINKDEKPNRITFDESDDLPF